MSEEASREGISHSILYLADGMAGAAGAVFVAPDKAWVQEDVPEGDFVRGAVARSSPRVTDAPSLAAIGTPILPDTGGYGTGGLWI